MGGGTRLVNPSGSQIMFYPETLMKDNFRYFGWKEGDAPIFLANNLGEAALYPLTSFTIEDGAHLIIHNNNLPANRYASALFALLPQAAIHADFKLNINEFKSQSGDIAETLADNPTVKVDGTYADGTTFSFDFCTK